MSTAAAVIKVQPWMQWPTVLTNNNISMISRTCVSLKSSSIVMLSLTRASLTSSNNSSSNSSSDPPSSHMAMARSDLDSCQWLQPSTQYIDTSSSSPSPSPLEASSFSDNGFSQSGSTPSSSSTKHSSILINAIPASRILESLPLQTWIDKTEACIERAIFDFRFLSMLAVAGSLAGSFLCFLKGCVFITESYGAFYSMCLRGAHTGKMVLRLVEAVDVYLTGTVMLIFGMGLYGLFISNVATNVPPNEDRALKNSSLFGMFLLQERPKWMRIASLDELKTKLGHVVVMILLVKMFERSKAVTVATGADLLSYSIAIFLTSGALLVLHKLHH